VLIGSHNESPQIPHAPEYIFFYGHRVPKIGGETPISSSIELFHRLQLEIPEFMNELGEKGILSRVVYGETPQFKGGSTLRQAFGKEIEDGDDEDTRRRKVEKKIRRYGRGEWTTWKWLVDGGLVLEHRLPAIRTQPGTGIPTLFTGLAVYYKMALEDGNEAGNGSENKKGANGNGNGEGKDKKLTTGATFGDGTPIPDKYRETISRITDEIKVLHKWQRGDVLVYDNVVAQHGRQPWEGEQEDRVVMASLWDGETMPGRYEAGGGVGKENQGWKQICQAVPE